MTMRLNPYLNFPGNTREAMEFYAEVLGGELVVHGFGDFGGDGPAPEGVMHAMLETPDGFTLMASDPPPGETLVSGTNISISLSGEDEAKLRGFFEGLSAGGTVMMPLERQMWGDVFGMVVDRFGTPWMVNITEVQA